MVRKLTVTLLVLGIAATALANGGQYRTSATEKGSVLVYPKVELRYSSTGVLLQDTFITIANDFNSLTPVYVHLFFVSETCTRYDNVIALTQNEPTYWAASTGQPKGVSPWSVLGAPVAIDPNNPASDRVLRGYIIAFAENVDGYPIRWNHLYGGATTVNYSHQDVSEYNAYAFAALGSGSNGLSVSGIGNLPLNGSTYDYGYAYLLLNFFASGSTALSGGGQTVTQDTDLSLMILSQDLRQDTPGPLITKAYFDIWNQNEVGFSGNEFCVVKYNSAPLSTRGGNFLLNNLQTNLGRARITGMASTVCNRLVRFDPNDPNSFIASTPQSLLGIAERVLTFATGGRVSTAAVNLTGAGTLAAQVLYDASSTPQERPQLGTDPKLAQPANVPLHLR